MGRQAHITRLALGRSPYGEPLRDENDEFIIGPHAHDDNDSGYHQQYDARGHPQNSATTNAIKILRRAQNDVLATVGVVVRKGEERKTKWEKLGDDRKWELICDENAIGSQLKGEDRVCGVVLPWCITSLRRRLMTFSPYFMSPVSHILRKEYRLFSPLQLLVPGLSEQLMSGVPQAFRHYVCEPNVEGLVNYANPWREDEWCDSMSAFVRWHSATTIMRCIELPLLVHGTLKCLFIIPTDTWLNWGSFVPFSTISPINIPVIPSVLTITSITTFTMELLRAPLFLYIVREYLQLQIGYRLYALFRQILTKPDRPDAISAKVADENEAIEETSIAGIGHVWPSDVHYERNKRYYGPKSFMGALRVAFPPIYRLLNKITKGRIARSRGRLTSLLNRQLRAAVRDRYWYERMDLIPVPRRGSLEDIALQSRIVSSVFRGVNLDPVEELVDKAAWTRDVLGPKADILGIQHDTAQTLGGEPERPPQPPVRSRPITVNEQIPEAVSNILAEAFRTMPESDAVLIQASDAPVIMFNSSRSINPQSVAEMDNVHVIEAANTSSAALMQAVRAAATATEAGNQGEPRAAGGEHQAARAREPSLPPTPAPGISRAVSLVDPQLRNSPLQPPFRPVRRPTETDDSLAAISETLRAEAGTLQSPRPSLPSPALERHAESLRQTIENAPDPPLTPLKHRQYRVTILSNHPTDSLAWHASALATSLIMLPFETIWLRAVANWALQNPAMGRYIDPWWAARLGFGVAGQPINVLRLGAWFGGASDASGRIKYTATILLTLGLEGMLRGVCWSVGVWYVKRLRQRFGWGHF